MLTDDWKQTPLGMACYITLNVYIANMVYTNDAESLKKCAFKARQTLDEVFKSKRELYDKMPLDCKRACLRAAYLIGPNFSIELFSGSADLYMTYDKFKEELNSIVREASA